jgi:hypothetical protein
MGGAAGSLRPEGPHWGEYIYIYIYI